MNIQETIYEHLTTNAGVVALVAARVYPVRMPQEPTLPCITYQRISGPVEYSRDGPGLTESRFQISCWAETYAGAIALAAAVRSAIGIFPEVSFLENQPDMYEPETSVYHIPVDVMIWHEE